MGDVAVGSPLVVTLFGRPVSPRKVSLSGSRSCATSLQAAFRVHIRDAAATQ